jgi:hypothetical protein
MVVHRAWADAENAGNFGIPFALTDPVEGFVFPRAQSRQLPQRVGIGEFGALSAVLAATHWVELSQAIQYPVVSLDWSEFMGCFLFGKQAARLRRLRQTSKLPQ